MRSGIGVTLAMEAMNSLDQAAAGRGDGAGGRASSRIVPDPETFRVIPYAPRTAAMLTDQLALDGNPAPVCQRSFLKRMEAALGARGAVFRAASRTSSRSLRPSTASGDPSIRACASRRSG